MPSLIDLRNRLRSVANIKQITTSMEMVASARLRKAQMKAKFAQGYMQKADHLVRALAGADRDATHPLFQKREVKKIGLLIISSDKGLCGPYNTQIFAAANRFCSEKHATPLELFLAGKKAIQTYQRKSMPIAHSWMDWSGKITFPEIQAISNTLTASFLSKQCDEIWVAYTLFQGVMKREVMIEKFLPLEKKAEGSNLNYLFEPNVQEIYDHVLPQYCAHKLHYYFANAYASELAARVFSMKAAAQNAEEMLENLTLERNKVRQASITREMLETLSP